MTRYPVLQRLLCQPSRMASARLIAARMRTGSAKLGHLGKGGNGRHPHQQIAIIGGPGGEIGAIGVPDEGLARARRPGAPDIMRMQEIAIGQRRDEALRSVIASSARRPTGAAPARSSRAAGRRRARDLRPGDDAADGIREIEQPRVDAQAAQALRQHIMIVADIADEIDPQRPLARSGRRVHRAPSPAPLPASRTPVLASNKWILPGRG